MLEIGVGTGQNLPYYPDAVRLTGVMRLSVGLEDLAEPEADFRNALAQLPG